MAAWEYEFYLRVLKVSLRGHVISSISFSILWLWHYARNYAGLINLSLKNGMNFSLLLALL